MGRREEGERDLRAAVALLCGMVSEYPDDRNYRHELATDYRNLGDLLLALGKTQVAEESVRRAVTLEEKLGNEFPNVVWYSTWGAHETLSRILLAEGRLAEAEQAVRRALAIVETPVADLPSGDETLSALARTASGPGELLWERGTPTESRQYFRRARDAWEGTSKSRSTVQHRKELSLLLADCPDPQLRNPDRAVALAREAVSQSPHMAAAWDALGIAIYRSGAAAEAVQPLLRSVEMTSGGSVKTWFFLALALAQARDKDEARKWYEKATSWMQKNTPKDPQLIRLRSEAAALLGPSGAPKGDPKEMNHSK